jgi:hypothetical protein
MSREMCVVDLYDDPNKNELMNKLELLLSAWPPSYYRQVHSSAFSLSPSALNHFTHTKSDRITQSSCGTSKKKRFQTRGEPMR